MNKKSITVIIKPKETFIQSASKDLITFGFLAFCVYISQNSTWWTFFTGCLFIFFISIKIQKATSDSVNEFDEKDDAINYLSEKH